MDEPKLIGIPEPQPGMVDLVVSNGDVFAVVPVTREFLLRAMQEGLGPFLLEQVDRALNKIVEQVEEERFARWLDS